MARTAVTVVNLARNALVAEVALQAADATNGMSVPMGRDGAGFVRITNTDGVAHNATIKALTGSAGDNLAVPVGIGATVLVGPLDAKYEQADEQIYIDFDVATGMKILGYVLPK